MIKRILYVDIESGGLDPSKNPLLQIACIYEENGEIKDTFEAYMRPIKGMKIEKEALEINGIKKKDIKTFPKSRQVFKKFIDFLDSKINKYDKDQKMVMVAHNAHFDKSFIEAWAIQNSYKYLHAYIDYRMIDTLMIARTEWYKGNINPPDFKLGTLCLEYGLEAPDHNAMTDIIATRNLLKEMLK